MENLIDRKERKEKEAEVISLEELSACSLSDLQAALACQMDWGVSDIFDEMPGIDSEKESLIGKNIRFLSLSSYRSDLKVQAKKVPSSYQSSKNKPLSESTKALLESPPKARISRTPAVQMAQVSIEKLTAELQKAKSVEDALACARSFGGAGLAQTALNDIRGSLGVEGAGFLVSSEISQEAERAGKIFVGEEGVLMKRLFASVDLSLETLGSAPALPWRPPGGRDPLPEEVEMCVPLLQKIIALSAPKWIVTFGSLSARMLLEGSPKKEEEQNLKDRFLRPTFRLSQVKGRWHEVSFSDMPEKIKVFPFISPARLKNSVRMRQSMWQDLQFFKQGLAKILEK